MACLIEVSWSRAELSESASEKWVMLVGGMMKPLLVAADLLSC